MSQCSDRSASTGVVVVLAVLGSVDWIAYLALYSAGPTEIATVIGALTTFVLGLGRVCSRLLGGRDERLPR